MSTTKLKECFWVWGHHTNCLYQNYGITRESHVSPVEGVARLGATNLVLDIMDAPVDRKEQIALAANLPSVGWSIMDAAAHPEYVTDLIGYSKEFKNLSRGIFDDFLCPANKDTNYTNYPPEMLAGYRKQLNDAGLEMWMVLYTENMRQIDMDVIRTYVEVFDGITLWFWNEQEAIEHFDEYVQTFLELTQGRKRMIGCYLYDFGSEKEATGKAVVDQLEKERQLILDGTIEGVILHTNAVMADDPYEAVEACVDWMAKHGEETYEI